MAESVVLLTRKKAARQRERVYPVVGKGKSHIHRAIEKLDGGPYYTIIELAFLIEREPKTVKKWHRLRKSDEQGELKPSKFVELHGELVYLYTPEDVERYRAFAESV